MRTIQPYLVTIALSDHVVVAAQHIPMAVVTDDEGNVVAREPLSAVDLDPTLGAELLGEINGGLLARIATMEATHAEQISALQAALAAATAPAESPSILTALDEAFETLVPAELREQFETAWVTVRGLQQVGKIARAAAFVRALPVPEPLEAVREQIATMIDGGA